MLLSVKPRLAARRRRRNAPPAWSAALQAGCGRAGHYLTITPLREPSTRSTLSASMCPALATSHSCAAALAGTRRNLGPSTATASTVQRGGIASARNRTAPAGRRVAPPSRSATVSAQVPQPAQYLHYSHRALKPVRRCLRTPWDCKLLISPRKPSLKASRCWQFRAPRYFVWVDRKSLRRPAR